MRRVIIRKSEYDYHSLKDDVFSLLNAFDGGRIKPGHHVLIKPNLLTAAKPHQAITTHPLVIKAACEYAINKGAKVQVSDSNAMSTFEKVINITGLKDALRGMPVELKELKESRPVRVDGRFKTLELSTDALDADVVINLPKFKTHSQMGLTLGIKNTFGCVIGIAKPEWHFRAGTNKEMFAELIVSIHNAINPVITLMDGILGMEGDGPGTSGSPRHIGVLMASDSALALDMAACRMVGLYPRSLLTNKAALKIAGDISYEIQGEMQVIKNFKIPDVKDLIFGPAVARGFLRRHIASRPMAIREKCRLCNECVRVCPAKAIYNIGKSLLFDYDKCIRCYCCLEACPHAAMFKHEGIVKKIVRKVYEAKR